jgi:hypothetical protein
MAPGCAALTFDADQQRCSRYAGVTALQAEPATSASVRRGPAWPKSAPAHVRWDSNATLCFAWSGEDISWLERLPPIVDFAIIAVTSVNATQAKSRAAPRELLRLGLRLKYYAELPFTPPLTPATSRNRPPSRARARAAAAASLAAVHFVSTFYHNLPPLILLGDDKRCSADDVGATGSTATGTSRTRRVSGPSQCPWAALIGARTRGAASMIIEQAIRAAHNVGGGPSEVSCLCKLRYQRSLAAHVRTRSAHQGLAPGPQQSVDTGTVDLRAARWFTAQFLGGNARSHERTVRDPPDGSLALPASRLRTRPLSSWLALHQLLLVDRKFPGVDASSWSLLVQTSWLDLLHAAVPESGGSAATGAGTGTGSTIQSVSDPCFESGTPCGMDRRDPMRLRARSADLLRTMRSAMPSIPTHLPSMPEVPERVRGWWHTARDRARRMRRGGTAAAQRAAAYGNSR